MPLPSWPRLRRAVLFLFLLARYRCGGLSWRSSARLARWLAYPSL
jgi:hypothetical protein